MKYYINLIKRKHYRVFIPVLIFAFLGIMVIIIEIDDVISRGFAWNEYRYYGNALFELLGSSNVGMILIGGLCIYFGLVFFPVTSPFAQDDSEFEVRDEGDDIHILFRKYEFLVKKESFSPSKFIIHDKNKRFVSMVRGYQVANYVSFRYANIINKEIDESKTITKKSVVEKFSNVRKMSAEEKMDYIKSHNLKDKPRVFFVITSAILWFFFTFWILGIVGAICELRIDFLISAVILAFITFILGKKSSKAINKNKRFINRIINEDMYIVKCEVYDRKHIEEDSDYYRIRISDGDNVVNQWIDIPKDRYEKKEKIVEFYVFDKTASDIFELK